MGNPPEINILHCPKLLVYTLTVVGIIFDTISFFINFIPGLICSLVLGTSSHIQENQAPLPFQPPLSAVLIRELLPAIKFSDVKCTIIGGGDEEAPPECAVCLSEFEVDEEIRCLKNCQDIFHRDCIDRWMDHGKKTCPLCRKLLVPVESRREFDHSLRTDSCVALIYEG